MTFVNRFWESENWALFLFFFPLLDYLFLKPYCEVLVTGIVLDPYNWPCLVSFPYLKYVVGFPYQSVLHPHTSSAASVALCFVPCLLS